MPWKHLILLTLPLWVVTGACLSLTARTVLHQGLVVVPGQTLTERLDETFRTFDGERPGVAVGVSRNGEVLYQAGHGLADLDSGQRIDPHTAFHIASVGKQMTAAAVMMLVEQGKVRLDEPAATYLKEMRGWAHRATVRQLLQHTAGIPDTYQALEEQGSTPTGLDALRLLASWRRLDFEPGAQFLYSDSGYDILGVLIERVSHVSYPRFLEEHILRPAGMAESFVYDQAKLAEAKRALGYQRQFLGGWELKDDSPLNLLYGSGGVYSTVADLARYDRALFGGILLRPASLAEMFKAAVLADGSVISYGFGWSVKTDEATGERTYAHSGNWLGFTSFYLHFPKDGLAVVVLANGSDIDSEALAAATAEIFRAFGNPKVAPQRVRHRAT